MSLHYEVILDCKYKLLVKFLSLAWNFNNMTRSAVEGNWMLSKTYSGRTFCIFHFEDTRIDDKDQVFGDSDLELLQF